MRLYALLFIPFMRKETSTNNNRNFIASFPLIRIREKNIKLHIGWKRKTLTLVNTYKTMNVDSNSDNGT